MWNYWAKIYKKIEIQRYESGILPEACWPIWKRQLAERFRSISDIFIGPEEQNMQYL